MTFDISKRAVAETATIDILDPDTGEPMLNEEGQPMTVTVYGPGSKTFATAKATASNRAVERLRRKGKVQTTAEEDAAATATFLTACTVSFNGFSYRDMPNAPDAFRALYLDPTLGFVTEQVNREMGDWANFTKAASSS